MRQKRKLRPAQKTVIPAYALTKPPAEARPVRPLAPSQLIVEEPATLSPLEESDRQWRFERGKLIHRLLQTLPDLPPEKRVAAAERYLKSASTQAVVSRETLIGEGAARAR